MRTKEFKNIFSILLSLILLSIGVLSGCAESDPRSDDFAQLLEEYDSSVTDELDFYDPVNTIQISGWLDESCVKNLMAFLANQYPQYKFKYRYISKESYESIIDAELSSKMATEIVMMTPTMAKKHAKNRYIEDLTLYCDNFTDKGREAFMYGNRIYAVPSTSDYQCLFYNKDLLEQSGQKLPISYNSFLELCDYMRTNMDVKPLSAGLKDSDKVADTALAILAAGYLSTAQGKKFGSRLTYGQTTFREEIRPYMNKWQEMCIHRLYTRDMCIMDEASAIDEFVSGKSFLYLGGLTDYNRIKEANPEMCMGTMAIPGDTISKSMLIGGCDCGFAVNIFSKNKTAAMEVVKAISTEDGQRALWSDRQGGQTYLKNVVFDNPDEFDEIRAFTSSDRVVMPWNQWGTNSSQIYEVFGRELQKVVLGERSIEVAFQVIDDEVKQILRED
ncbi:ABC transporter substrate-binding protein [Butyrivibrio sp. VCB2006]|uniref:ABC transporter substrate-binding protein n=1 Tax=Butyrivibrio sp. VCB2006 TaxID=1280679 RepID=UPI00042A3979|nr:extracellular solute-binding protein [Butyrivibrio sp. VCB2006]